MIKEKVRDLKKIRYDGGGIIYIFIILFLKLVQTFREPGLYGQFGVFGT